MPHFEIRYGIRGTIMLFSGFIDKSKGIKPHCRFRSFTKRSDPPLVLENQHGR